MLRPEFVRVLSEKPKVLQSVSSLKIVILIRARKSLLRGANVRRSAVAAERCTPRFVSAGGYLKESPEAVCERKKNAEHNGVLGV